MFGDVSIPFLRLDQLSKDKNITKPLIASLSAILAPHFQ